MVKSFIDAFPALDAKTEAKLKNLLDDLEDTPSSFCGLVWLHDHDFIYISRTVEHVIGHKYTNFEQNGLLFFQSITPFRLVTHIFENLHRFIQQLEDHPLFLGAPLISNVHAALLDDNGEEIPITHYSTFLDMKPSKPTSYLILGFWIDSRVASMQPPSVINSISDRLLEIKSLYHQLQPERMHYLALAKRLTPREREVTALLAEGLNTKDISNRLHISYNTVESHRKNLLDKFGVRNTTELIYRATKIMEL